MPPCAYLGSFCAARGGVSQEAGPATGPGTVDRERMRWLEEGTLGGGQWTPIT